MIHISTESHFKGSSQTCFTVNYVHVYFLNIFCCTSTLLLPFCPAHFLHSYVFLSYWCFKKSCGWKKCERDPKLVLQILTAFMVKSSKRSSLAFLNTCLYNFLSGVKAKQNQERVCSVHEDLWFACEICKQNIKTAKQNLLSQLVSLHMISQLRGSSFLLEVGWLYERL